MTLAPTSSTGFYYQLTIQRSEAKSWHDENFHPKYAYDGNYDTFYSVKTGDTQDNFLKLFLSKTSIVCEVRITSRLDCCAERMVGTSVRVFSGAEEVADCGTIEGYDTSWLLCSWKWHFYENGKYYRMNSYYATYTFLIMNS